MRHGMRDLLCQTPLLIKIGSLPKNVTGRGFAVIAVPVAALSMIPACSLLQILMASPFAARMLPA
jgi:hypothetical protein